MNSLNEAETGAYLMESGYSPLAVNGSPVRLRQRVLYVLDDPLKIPEYYGDLPSMPSFAVIETPIAVAAKEDGKYVLRHIGRTLYWTIEADGSCTLLRISSSPKAKDRTIKMANLLSGT